MNKTLGELPVKFRCYKYRPQGMCSAWAICRAETFSDFLDELAASEVGDVWEIGVVEMTQEQLDALPEHEGF